MKIHTIALLSILSLCVALSCSSDDDTNLPQEVEQIENPDLDTNLPPDPSDDSMDNPPADLEAVIVTDVSYGDHPQQVYDLYLPQGRTAEKTKVMVLIHGGGWTTGDKQDLALFVNYLLENHPDHAIVNLNYVLAQIGGPAAFPNQYLDIDAALNQIIAQQESLQILPEFGFLGTSAGAHLAMMYDYTYDTNDIVKFVIDIVGPSDFTDPFYADDPSFPLALSLLADASQFPAGTDLAAANSPAVVVHSGSSPTFLFYGDQDPIVPITNGERLNAALDNQNVTHEFTIYEGGHGDDWSDADGLDLSLKTSSYVNTYLAID